MKLKNYIHEVVDDLMESDDFYAAKATHLKPASLLKAEHQKALEGVFELEDFTEKIDTAFYLLGHNDFFSKKDKELLEKEFFEQLEQLNESMVAASTEGVIPQHQLHISNEAFDLIYQFGVQCLTEEKHADAEAIFTLTTFLNPGVLGSLIGLTMALFHQAKYQLAMDLAPLIIEIDPTQAVGWVYLILAKKAIDMEASIEDEKSQVQEVFKSNPPEKSLWEETVKPYF